MVRANDIVVDLKDIDKDDVAYVGGKSANLGEMIKAGFPVPGGFVITAQAYFTFIRENQLEQKIKHLLTTINYQNPESVQYVSGHIRSIIRRSPIPTEITNTIFRKYNSLEKGEAFVAIRSSATSEDSKDASFAGQQETFLNVKGDAAVIDAVRRAWASLYNARAVYYRHQNRLDRGKSGIALVVQRMVNSDVSGIMFTIDPVTNNKDRLVIEAIFGLGEYIVGGKVTPDHYEVDKASQMIIVENQVPQKVMLKRHNDGNKEIKIPFYKQKSLKLQKNHLTTLAKLGESLEKHYYFPQDIEWALEKNKVYIVQTRPITTTGMKTEATDLKIPRATHPILKGDPASPGIGIGHAKVLSSPREMGKIKNGDILVAQATNPDFVPAMKKASAIITEKGGRTSHAAIVAREFGIPAVVGTPRATTAIRDDMILSVNGSTGEIYRGKMDIIHTKKSDTQIQNLKTKVYVNLAEPELAEKISGYPVDGIGLLRAEFVLAELGVHPKKIISEHKEKKFINDLALSIEKFARAFYPRPVLYRATDFKTNEYKNLLGGKLYEPIEQNPMLGYRGAFRYIRDEKVFRLELEAIKKVREKYNNLELMIPFVRTVKELRQVKDIVAKSNLKRSKTFKLYMMVEIPSNVILIEDFIKTGIDGISIGSNDLTMLILGLDRDNEEVAIEFDERNPAVLWALEKVVKAGRKAGIPVGICGQAPSQYPDLTEQLVKWGITSISVSPDAVSNTREHIYHAERRMKG